MMASWWTRLGGAPGARVQDFLETLVRVTNVLTNELRTRTFDGVIVMDRGLQCQLALRALRGLPRGRLLPLLLRVLPAADVVVHLEVRVDEALARVVTRGTDQESRSGLDDLGRAYGSLPERPSFLVLDANRSREEILEDLLGLVSTGGPAGGRGCSTESAPTAR